MALKDYAKQEFLKRERYSLIARLYLVSSVFLVLATLITLHYGQ